MIQMGVGEYYTVEVLGSDVPREIWFVLDLDAVVEEDVGLP